MISFETIIEDNVEFVCGVDTRNSIGLILARGVLANRDIKNSTDQVWIR